MAGFCRQRAESFTLDFQNSSADVVPSAVLSPITELSLNFEHNSISLGKTPKRKLSLSNCGTPTASPCFLRTNSSESGYCPDSPMWPGLESPTIEMLRSSATDRKKSFQLRRPSFRRWNSSPAGSDDSNKENFDDYPVLPMDSCCDGDDGEDKEEFVFARPRVPSFVRRFSMPSKSGRSLPQRSFSDPMGDQSPGCPFDISPAKSDSQDSGTSDMELDDADAGDDGFIDDLVDDAQYSKDDNSIMPSGMADLLSAPLVSSDDSPESNTNSLTQLKGETPKQISCVNSEARPRDLFNSTADKASRGAMRPRSKSFALKRPNPPRDPSPMEKKRLRQRCMSLVEGTGYCQPLLENRRVPKRSPLRRSNSEVFESTQFESLIRAGCNRTLIGDFSKPYCLPSISGQHEDLKCITPETVSKLINGDFKEVDAYYIIDCRYPFEFNGGHVKGAMNIYTKEEMLKEFVDSPKCKDGKRVIIIFHCEFSSKRGPDMCRFIRNRDRDIHRPSYPALFYPELYLLDGGYKNFFQTCKEHCDPQNYILMLDENHANDLKLFSKRSKSWSEGNSKKTFRPGLSYR